MKRERWEGSVGERGERRKKGVGEGGGACPFYLRLTWSLSAVVVVAYQVEPFPYLRGQKQTQLRINATKKVYHGT